MNRPPASTVPAAWVGKIVAAPKITIPRTPRTIVIVPVWLMEQNEFARMNRWTPRMLLVDRSLCKWSTDISWICCCDDLFDYHCSILQLYRVKRSRLLLWPIPLRKLHLKWLWKAKTISIFSTRPCEWPLNTLYLGRHLHWQDLVLLVSRVFSSTSTILLIYSGTREYY